MSGNINLKFKKEKDYQEFCNLFKDIPLKNDYITLKYDLGDEAYDPIENQRTVCYLNLSYHNYKRIISFEYPYSDCHSAFCFYLAKELSKKYSILVDWDSGAWKPAKDFFSHFKRNYQSSIVFELGGYKFEKEIDTDSLIKNTEDPFKERLEMCIKIEDNLRDIVCPGFFENNKFKEYIWK